MSNFYIEKNKETNETVYIEFDKMDGYQIKPKKQPDDSVSVSKIVFVSPTLTEKIIKTKIDHQISKLLLELKIFEDSEDASEDGIRKSLMDAERLKLNILNKYVKFLGNTYRSLTLEKIQLIIKNLRYRLYEVKEQQEYLNNFIDTKKGKGR